MNPELSRILDLPLPEQLQLVEDLWDHIAASEEPLPVPDWQKDELDRRKRTTTPASPASSNGWPKLVSSRSQPLENSSPPASS